MAADSPTGTPTPPSSGDPDATLPGDPQVDRQATDGTLVAETMLADDSAGGSDRPPETGYARGQTLGRYVVLDTLGKGGMGVVYAGFDPELDRKVAIKVVRSDLGGDAELNRTRLLREAQALAQLSHPNIVSVYDVGVAQGEVWLAMEFVSGQTLGRWLEAGARGWREVLEVMRPAARGLSAAHEVGLVHRDFKPDNVMIGDDGRVRVMDFGLARRAQGDASPETERELEPQPEPMAALASDRAFSGSRASNLSNPLTRAGTLSGTPRYMPPEQFAGEDAGGGSDQFSYCVALWEALYGQPPFAGKTLMALSANIIEGRRRAPPRGRAVPGWLHAVVERGLATDPADRWPSMPALLEALDRSRRRRNRRVGALGLGLVAAVSAGLMGVRGLETERTRAACRERADAVVEIWNEDARARVRVALLAGDKPYAPAAAERVLPQLDAHAQAWREASEGACLDARLRGGVSADDYDRQRQCLDTSLARLRALVTELSEPGDDDPSLRAVTASSALGRPADCRDPLQLARLPLPAEDRRAAVQAVRADLARGEMQQAVGRAPAAMQTARAALADAETLEWPPLVAEAKALVGRAHQSLGQYPEAEQILREAYFDAASSGADASAFAVAMSLVDLVADELARPDDGEDWHRHGEVLRPRLPDPDGLRMARSHTMLGVVRANQGRHDEAIPLLLEAHALRVEALGAGHPDAAMVLNQLAVSYGATGDRTREAELYSDAVERLQAALGPDHPQVAGALNNLATSYAQAGDYTAAQEVMTRAIGILESALGSEHAVVGQMLVNLGSVQLSQGDEQAALASYERALPILEAKLGSEHPVVGTTLKNLAWIHFGQGRYDEASRLFERVLEMREVAFGEDHPSLGDPLTGLGEAARRRGDLETAAHHYRRAIAIHEADAGPEASDLAYPARGLAQVALAEGRSDEALTLARRSAALVRAKTDNAIEHARSDFVLAQALVRAEGPSDEAEALARSALSTFANKGDDDDEDEHDEIAAFLDAQF